jgi:hypothetical protein
MKSFGINWDGKLKNLDKNFETNVNFSITVASKFVFLKLGRPSQFKKNKF